MIVSMLPVPRLPSWTLQAAIPCIAWQIRNRVLLSVRRLARKRVLILQIGE